MIRRAALALESFREVAEELQPALRKLAQVINPFMNDVVNTFQNGISVSKNLNAEYKKLVVTIPPQNWHEIGATGEPSFENSWTNLDSAVWNTAAFRIDFEGRVHLKGSLDSGTYSNAAFTLPVGYRPTLAAKFTIPSTSAGYVDVNTDGTVIPYSGGATWFSIDGVSFAATSPAAPLCHVSDEWPVRFSTRVTGAIHGVILARIHDVDSQRTTTLGGGTLHWDRARSGEIMIRSLDMLTPGRKYEITVLVLGE